MPMMYFSLFKELGWIVNKTQLSDKLVAYPTPQPDPEAIANKSVNCFHEYQVVEKPSLKKLLITNWAFIYSGDMLFGSFSFWEMLFYQVQAELYVYNSQRLEFIRITSIEHLNLEIFNIEPISRRDALKIAARQGMSADEVVLIDYQYGLNLIYQLNHLESPYFAVQTSCAFTDTFYLKNLQQINLKKFKEIIKSLDCSAITGVSLLGLDGNTNDYCIEIFDSCPNITRLELPVSLLHLTKWLEERGCLDKIKTIYIDSYSQLSKPYLENISEYFSKLNFNTLEELILNNIPIAPTHILIESWSDGTQVFRENQVDVDLTPIKHLAKKITLRDTTLIRKKKLTYSEMEMTFLGSISEFSQDASRANPVFDKIKSSWIRRLQVHAWPDEGLLVRSNLSNVHSASFLPSPFQIDRFILFLQALPNLQNLEIVIDWTSKLSTKEIEKLGAVILPQLKSIEFCVSDPSIDFIKQCIAMSPHLEACIFSISSHQIGKLSGLSFPKSLLRLNISLSELLTNDKSCTIEFIQHQLIHFLKSNSQTLRTLEITFSSNQNTDEDNDEQTTSLLDYINLSALGDDAFPNLIKLSIENGKLQNHIIPLIKASKSTLEFIMIDSCDGSQSAIKDVLEICPRLKIKKLIDVSDEHESKNYSKSNILDDNTLTHADTPMTATQHFLTKNPAFNNPSLYVKNTFDSLVVDSEEHLSLDADLGVPLEYECQLKMSNKLVDYFDEQTDPLLALGQVNIGREDGEWYSLPALSLEDELLAVDANEPLIIGRYANGVYAVRRLFSGEPLEVQFLLRTRRVDYTAQQTAGQLSDRPLSPDEFFSNMQLIKTEQGFDWICRNPALQTRFASQTQFYRDHMLEGMNDLIQFCRSFTNQPLPPSPQPRQGLEIFNAILEHKRGACRHVVYIFMAIAPHLYPGIPVTAITNDTHAFIVLLGSIILDLGGHPVQLEVIPFQKKASDLEVNDAEMIDEAPSIVESIDFRESSLQSLLEPDWVVQTLIERSHQLPAHQRQILVICQNKEQIRDLAVFISSAIGLNRKKLHCIDNLDMLRATQYTILDNGQYMELESPDRLFLKQASANDILLMNYASAKPEHVGYNSVVDENRQLLNQTIPHGLLVIVAISQEQVSVLREDFYSRFDRKKGILSLAHCSFPTEWRQAKPFEIIPNHSIHAINLYEANDWQQILVNNIQFHQEGIVWKPGLILKFSEKIKQDRGDTLTLYLVNPPLHNEYFISFWTQINTTKSLIANGLCYVLPDKLKIICISEPYLFSQDTYSIEVHTNQPWSYSLNVSTFDKLFHRYRVNQWGNLETSPGLLEDNRGKKLTLMVSETIDKARWAKLLDKAKSQRCFLQLILAPGVLLPSEMKSPDNNTSTALGHIEFSQSIPEQHCVIVSADPDYTLEMLKSVSRVLTITPDIGKEMCEKWSVQQKQDSSMGYSVEQGILLQQLQQGHTVVLKGELSHALANQLDTVFSSHPSLPFQDIQIPITGRLIIITPKAQYFSFMPAYHHEVSDKEYWDCLSRQLQPDQLELIRKLCNRFALNLKSFAQVKQLVYLFTHFPHRCPIEPWVLLQQNPKEMLEQIAKEYPNAFTPVPVKLAQRLHDIQIHLQHFPTLFLVGPSGTGKSTMVLKSLPEHYKNCGISTRVFVGMDKINVWINQPEIDNTLNILFIDEANLAHEGAYDFLGGLTQLPPRFIHQGKQYVVPKHSKIIFAGNYFNYQSRQAQQIFQQLGNAMHFPPCSMQEIRDQQLYPLLDLMFANNPEIKIILTDILLRTLVFIQNQLPHVTLTSRNLHAMVLLCSVYMNQPSNPFPPELLARWAVYQTIKSLLSPYELEQLIVNVFYNQHYQIEFQKGFSLPSERFDEFIVTNIHIPTLIALNEELAIRELRQQHLELEEYGTRGLLIQGPSGIGKSSIVIASLKAKGFIDVTNSSIPSIDTPVYYHLSRSLGLEKIKTLAAEAFHGGGVVIIDEANSLPLEHFFNDLLTGIDANGNKAKHPGFFLIATQNPPDFNGRSIQSAAFLNRLRLVDLAEYPEAELKIILQSRFMLHPKLANLLIKQHLKEKQNSAISPTLRDLIREAEKAIVEHQYDLSLIEQPEKKNELLQEFNHPKMSYQNKVLLLRAIIGQTKIEETKDCLFLMDVLDLFAVSALNVMKRRPSFFSTSASHPMVDINCLCQEAWKKLAPYLKKMRNVDDKQQCIDKAKKNKLFLAEIEQFSTKVMQKVDKMARQIVVEKKRQREVNSNHDTESGKKQQLERSSEVRNQPH